MRSRVLGPGAVSPDVSGAEFGSTDYWRRRYASGGRAGKGTYGRLGAFKAEVVNGFFRREGVTSAVEFGCGDGDQAALFKVARYTGVDVSEAAIARAKAQLRGRTGWHFMTFEEAALNHLRAEASLSLDVIFHLVEDDLFEQHMRRLFEAAERFVVIYSSNKTDSGSKHGRIRHRVFTDWIAANASDWTLLQRIPNRFPRRPWAHRGRSFCDFYIYQRRNCANRSEP
jgi:SAM-dependent methyltransferase